MSPSLHRPSSMLDLLRQRAEQTPDHATFTFLDDGERAESPITDAALYDKARAIAAALQARTPAGARVLLLYPPGLEYIAALYGCFASGRYAVPAYPPDPGRLARTLPRLQAIAADAGAAIVLTTRAIASMAQAVFAFAPDLGGLPWLATDDLDPGHAASWQDPGVDAASVALLQYTSGSTGSPKGVVISHGNLLHNADLIEHSFGNTPDSVGVIWLPPYHDMGLVGGLVAPLYSGARVYLMSPLAFLQRPVRWLQAISRHRATTSGGPNFGYDLCVRKVDAAAREGLDLSSWRLAFNGAEPVRAETLRRFAATFADCGLASTALYPCYGLAEVTLIATGARSAASPRVLRVDSAALDAHRAVATTADDARELASSGAAAPGLEVIAVDGATGQRLPDGQVGEIWIAGASVAAGYWGRTDETAATFGALLATGDGPFLRTGDLGFVDGGELFVTGRVKDLIIVRGRNLYPQDIEVVAGSAHAALRPGCTAAFSIDADGNEQLVVVQETEKATTAVDLDAARIAVRRRVLEAMDIAPHDVVLIKSGTGFKTSSGKIQRQATKQAYLAGQLERA